MKDISELYRLCTEYPPDLEKIEEKLASLNDISVLYGIDKSTGEKGDPEDFLSELILDYFYRINGEFKDNGEGNCKSFDEEPIHEDYIVDIIKIFLRYGYDMRAYSGKIGAACLKSLVYSGFKEHLMEVAQILIDNGADPGKVTKSSIHNLENSYRMIMENLEEN